MSYEELVDRALNGELGEGAQIAAKVLKSIARAMRASGYVKITSAHISGVNYYNIGDAGLELLQDLSRNTRFTVPTTINPCGAPVTYVSEEFRGTIVEKQRMIYEAFKRMGSTGSCTCTPYEGQNLPSRGDHVSWAESSAVVYGNSVLGLYTNKEGGISALAAAVLGITPNYGMHLDENRRPKKRIRLNFRIKGEARFGALGYIIGKSTVEIVSIKGIEGASRPELKSLSAAIGTYGPQPMFVIESEGSSEEVEEIVLEEKDITTALQALSDQAEPQAIVLGCPFIAEKELSELTEALAGRRLKIPMLIFADSKSVQNITDEQKTILSLSGARIFTEVCPSLSYLPETFGYISVATNSVKHVFYTKHQSKVNVKVMDMSEMIERYTEKT